MRKLIITFLFVITSIFSFSAVNDGLNLLNDEEKTEINDKIEEIKNEKDLTVFVNTLSIDEGFVVSDPERALILNIKKGNRENYKVEISFSKDIDVDDYEKDINGTLDDSQVLLERKEYKKYILTVLDGVSSVLQEIDVEPLNQMTMTKQQEKGSTTVLAIVFFGVVGAIIFKIYEDYKNRNKKDEDDDSIL